MANLKVKLKVSLNSCGKSQVATAKSLGLSRINQIKEQPDNNATRGKIRKISHLVEVQEA